MAAAMGVLRKRWRWSPGKKSALVDPRVVAELREGVVGLLTCDLVGLYLGRGYAGWVPSFWQNGGGDGNMPDGVPTRVWTWALVWAWV